MDKSKFPPDGRIKNATRIRNARFALQSIRSDRLTGDVTNRGRPLEVKPRSEFLPRPSITRIG